MENIERAEKIRTHKKRTCTKRLDARRPATPGAGVLPNFVLRDSTIQRFNDLEDGGLPTVARTETSAEGWLAGSKLEVLLSYGPPSLRYGAAVFALRCAPSEDWCPRQDLNLYGVTH